MNVLYVGPYKSSTTIRYASLDIIYELSQARQISNIDIRPIFINNKNQSNSDLIINNLSKKQLANHYDVIIQHAPITMLSDTFGLADKNVAIPLFDKIINSNRYQKQLENIDLVLTDSPDFSEFLENHYAVKAVNTFSYTKLYSSHNQIQFPIYENTRKIYSIYHSYDADIFNITITAFYEAFAADDNTSLIYAIKTTDQATVNKINQDFDEIKKTLGIKSNIFNIQIMLKDFSFDELCSIHNKCDLYLDLEQNNLDSKLHRHIARQMNKQIIIDQNIENDITPTGSQRGVFTPFLGTSNLITKMNQSISSHNNFDTFPSISNLICQ